MTSIPDILNEIELSADPINADWEDWVCPSGEQYAKRLIMALRVSTAVLTSLSETDFRQTMRTSLSECLKDIAKILEGNKVEQ